MSFGNRLRSTLELRQYSQSKVCMDLGIAPSTLSGYIHHRREPDCKTLILLASYLEVSTDYLLGAADK